MNLNEDRQQNAPLPLASLISEAVYKLVVGVERLIRWTARYILKPCLLQFRCLFW